MKKRKIIAEVIDPGRCKHYRRGQKFFLDGIRPPGFCESGYLAVSQAAKDLLRDGSTEPSDTGRILTRCSRSQGAVWEVRLEEVAETKQKEELGDNRRIFDSHIKDVLIKPTVPAGEKAR